MAIKKGGKARKVKCILCYHSFLENGRARKNHALKPEDTCKYHEPQQVGRPTKFSKKILIKTYKYIASCKDKEKRIIKSEGVATTTWDNHLDVNIPTIDGLARYLQIATQTVYDWKKKSLEFSDALGELKQLQSERLIKGGLSGRYNSTIAKVLLSANHGIHETKELTGPKGTSLFGSLIDEIDEEDDNK